MEFQDVVRRRHMVRRYDPDRPVPPDVRERILRNAGCTLLVLEGGDRDRYWDTATQDGNPAYDGWVSGLRTAPMLVLPFARQGSYVETGMAALLMLQTAVDEGVGACFFGLPAARIEAVEKEFGVPDGYDPIGVISVGYPASDRRSAAKRRRREVVHRGHWGRH